jgi:hypothetical protein
VEGEWIGGGLMIEDMKEVRCVVNKTFHMQLRDRVMAFGDATDGQWHLVADILEHAATEACRWTNRADDARRIPDMLDEAVRFCRQQAAGGE